MRFLHFFAVIGVLSGSLGAQTPSVGRFDLARLRLGTDTLEIRVHSDASLRFRMIERFERGTGPNAGRLRQTSVVTGYGENGLTSIDTVLVDAATLSFQRSVTARFGSDGRALYRAVETRQGDSLVTDEPGDTGRVVTRTAVPRGAALLAMPNLVMRAAPLSRGWHPTLQFRIPSAGRPMVITVDSVTTGSDHGRRAWFVHANPGDRSRLRYAIDSLTRDLIEFAVHDSLGEVVSTVSNLRYQPRATLPAAPLLAADAQRIAGHYFLEGVREVGSELLLKPDGSFEFMLAYGALDQIGTGRWTVRDGTVFLQHTGTRGPRDLVWFDAAPATFADGALDVAIEGRTLRYVRH